MSPGTTEAFTYAIRPTSESSFAVEVFKTGLLRRKKHIFFFGRYDGKLEYDFEHPERSNAEIRVDATSAVCRDEWISAEKRKDVLRVAKQEMLASNEHPHIVFSSREIRRKAQHRFEVDGTLTIRGIAKPVTLNVASVPVGKERFELDITARIKMTDYGLKPPSSMLGLIGTKDEMRVRCLLFPERS